MKRTVRVNNNLCISQGWDTLDTCPSRLQLGVWCLRLAHRPLIHECSICLVFDPCLAYCRKCASWPNTALLCWSSSILDASQTFLRSDRASANRYEKFQSHFEVLAKWPSYVRLLYVFLAVRKCRDVRSISALHNFWHDISPYFSTRNSEDRRYILNQFQSSKVKTKANSTEIQVTNSFFEVLSELHKCLYISFPTELRTLEVRCLYCSTEIWIIRRKLWPAQLVHVLLVIPCSHFTNTLQRLVQISSWLKTQPFL